MVKAPCSSLAFESLVHCKLIEFKIQMTDAGVTYCGRQWRNRPPLQVRVPWPTLANQIHCIHTHVPWPEKETRASKLVGGPGSRS